jgi:O-acetyl-ADP-ribose deacetylase (regulator of RNase III)
MIYVINYRISDDTIANGTRLQVRQGDITEEDVDAIVNAANEHLAHGGGVAGAISRAGGHDIQKESNQWVKKYGIVETGQVAVTGPGRMICKCVIHAGLI